MSDKDKKALEEAAMSQREKDAMTTRYEAAQLQAMSYSKLSSILDDLERGKGYYEEDTGVETGDRERLLAGMAGLSKANDVIKIPTEDLQREAHELRRKRRLEAMERQKLEDKLEDMQRREQRRRRQGNRDWSEHLRERADNRPGCFACGEPGHIAKLCKQRISPRKRRREPPPRTHGRPYAARKRRRSRSGSPSRDRKRPRARSRSQSRSRTRRREAKRRKRSRSSDPKRKFKDESGEQRKPWRDKSGEPSEAARKRPRAACEAHPSRTHTNGECWGAYCEWHQAWGGHSSENCHRRDKQGNG
jgi:hypothetical protein